MPQASGSRHSLGYMLEASYGVTPATPTFKAFRHNSTSLNLSKNTFTSNELRADRQLADFRHGTHAIGGNVVGELSSVSYDDMLEAMLGGTWAAGVLKVGNIRRSFTFERWFQDVGQYLRYVGIEADTLALSMTTGAIVGVTMGFMGKAMTVASATIAGATYPAAGTTSPMDALTGVLQEGGVTNGVVTEVSLNLNNNLSQRYVIGSAYSLEPNQGRSILTGTMSAFFEDVSLYNKFVNETSSSLSVVASDGVNTYTFLVPKIKYTGADVPVAGEGSVSMSMPFQGLLDSATGTNFQITKAP